MLATTTPFQTMVEGQEQTVAWSLSMTLPAAAAAYDDVTLALQKLQVDYSTETDAPEGTRLQDGYSSAQASFTLSGEVDQSDESKTAAWLFGAYSTTSPLYHSDAFRAPVVIKLGLYPDGAGGVPELLQKFTGYVDGYQVDEDGNVAFTCLDLRSNFRGTVTTPAVITAPPYNAGLTSEYAIDAILRAASGGTVSSWPAQRAQCVLAVGMRSSVWPEVGTLVTGPLADAIFSPFVPGVYGTALGVASVEYTLSSPINGDDAYIELITPAIDSWGSEVQLGVPGSQNQVTFTLLNTGPVIQLSSVAQTQVGLFTFAPLSAGVRRLGLHLHWPVLSTSWHAELVADDGTTQATGAQTASAARSTGMTVAFLSGGDVTSLEAVQITTETSAPASLPVFVPQAVLAPSLNPLQLVPASEGDPWATLQTIVAAELGVIGDLNNDGTVRFLNRHTIASKASSRTVTSTASLTSVGISQTAAAVVNRARIGWTGWTFATTASTVYSATAPIKVAKHSTKVVNATLDSFAVNLDSSLSVLPNNSTNTTNSWYRASTNKAGTAQFTNTLTFVVSQASADKLTITITNSSGADAWLVSPANYTDIPVGTPVLRIAGTAVVANDEIVNDWQWPPTSSGGAASSRFGEVAFELTGNPWIQDDDAAAQLAQDIVLDSYIPRPDLTGVTIVPDPRLQLTDVALIQDLDRTGVNEYGRIFNSTITFEAGDPPTYEQTIDARTLAPPGGWIMGVAGRSEMGATTFVYS